MTACSAFANIPDTELGIPLVEIPSFARWLLHYKEGLFSQAARKMLFYASEAGNPAATLLIVAYAYEGGNLHRPEFKEPQKLLKKIVERDKDQRAMIQQALILIHYGDVKEGQKMLEDATKLESTGSLKHNTFSNTFDSIHERVAKRMSNFQQDPLEHLDSARAWRELAIVRLNTGEYTAAMDAFRKAALELDDPLAYSYLASDQEHNGRKYSSKWVEYSIKAASGGHPASAYALAKMYSLPRVQISKEVKDRSVRRDILSTTRRTLRGLINLLKAASWPARWSVDENRMEWALDWFQVGTYRRHADSVFEQAKLRWSLGTDLDSYSAVSDLLKLGSARRGTFENYTNMMAKMQAQLREWTATERGLKALKVVKEKGEVPIPASLVRLIPSREGNSNG